jgi:hypothetical protein
MKIIDIPRSGSAGSVTSSRNRAGQYTRNRRSPVQPIGTGRRAIIRAAFSAASVAWAALTDAQRYAWSAFADSFPYVDSLGQTIKLTGHQLFVAAGTQLINCGQGLPTDAPPSAAIFSAAGSALTVLTDTPTMIVGLSSDGSAADFNVVQVSPPVSAGRMFNGRWWQVAVAAGNVATVDIQAAYAAEFGAVSVGQKVFCKVTPVSQYGLTGTSVISSLICEAGV